MKKSLLIASAFLVVADLCFPAEPQSPDAGRKLEQTACSACHSLRLIESQRLSATAWGKELDKMTSWGATVPDRQLLIDYLAAQYGDARPVPVPPLSGNGSK